MSRYTLGSLVSNSSMWHLSCFKQEPSDSHNKSYASKELDWKGNCCFPLVHEWLTRKVLRSEGESEASRMSQSSGPATIGCPPQEHGRPVETHHALLFSTPLHFLNKGRKQGRARIVQPSAELFDRMQCSAGKPRQSVSRGPLSAQYSTVPDFQISICGARTLFSVFAFCSFIFMRLMQYLWCRFQLMIWSSEILLVGTNPREFISCAVIWNFYAVKFECWPYSIMAAVHWF